MEIPEVEFIHALTFSAPGYENKEITVTSPYLPILHKFISTHLNSDAIDFIKSYHIDNLPAEITDNMDETDLIYYKLKSNKTRKSYLIPSSNEIIEECGTLICNEISSCTEFGCVITMTDLPIMYAITKLISTFELGYIKDTQIVNDDLIKSKEEAMELGGSVRSYEGYFICDDALDDSHIYDTMQSRLKKSKSDEIPFTMEGYVSAFTQLLYDPREI